MAILSVNGAALPAPTEIKTDDEIIWSSNTGRSASGSMIGDVVAEKKTVTIKWEYLRENEVAVIKNNLAAGFFPFTFHDDGIDITITSYRGTISKEQLGNLGDGYFWYKSVSVKIVQK